MTTSGFSWHHLNQWHLGVAPLLLLAIALGLYLAGMRRVGSWSRWNLLWFGLGILVTFVATQSVLGVYDMNNFAIHMIQHLLLIMVAAPLFALARPLDLAYLASGSLKRRLFDSAVWRGILSPLVAFAAYFIFIPVAHLTGLFTLMMRHEWIHHGEQIAFLVVGYLFFRAAFGRERGRVLHPGLRLVFVMAAVPVDTFTGLSILMTNHLPFPGYLMMMPMGTSATAALNQYHLGGSIMWIGGDALMLLACIPIVVTWVRYETAHTKVTDAELDRLGL